MQKIKKLGAINFSIQIQLIDPRIDLLKFLDYT